jgi:hypothetical protein
MSQSHEYLNALLDNVSRAETLDPSLQSMFGAIKTKLARTSNISAELRRLYKVRNQSEFALGLMWIVNRAETDSSMLVPSPDDEFFIENLFRQGNTQEDVGQSYEPTIPEPQEAVAETIPTAPSAASDMYEFPPPEPTVMPSDQQSFSTGEQQSGEASSEASGVFITVAFPGAFEKFVIAIQGGDENRSALLEELRNECQHVSGNDLTTISFSKALTEFLTYIQQNDYLDDVRVMNLVSNLSDSISRGATAGASTQPGFIMEAYDVIKNYKTMFE